LITERPIRFVLRRIVVEHVKPRPHWATIHAVVAVFSDYSRRFSQPKTATMVAEKGRWFRRPVPYFRKVPFSATIYNVM